MAEISKLTKEQIDIIREVGSIGSGNAATGISRIIHKRVDIAMPKTEVASIEQVPEFIAPLESIVTTVYIRMTGNINGSLLLICPQEDALRLSSLMAKDNAGADGELNEFKMSALKELANILFGCYLKAVSELINVSIKYSPPDIATDMLGAIIDGVLIELNMDAEGAVIIETDFMVENEKIKGHILFLPNSAGLNLIVEKIGMGKKTV